MGIALLEKARDSNNSMRQPRGQWRKHRSSRPPASAEINDYDDDGGCADVLTRPGCFPVRDRAQTTPTYGPKLGSGTWDTSARILGMPSVVLQSMNLPPLGWSTRLMAIMLADQETVCTE